MTRGILLRTLTAAFAMIIIAAVAAQASAPADGKIREAIERTQTMLNAITRCAGADDRGCADGLAFAKLAREAAEVAVQSGDVKDGAKTHLRTAIEHLNAVMGFLGQGRNAEALPIGRNAFESLLEADKAS